MISRPFFTFMILAIQPLILASIAIVTVESSWKISRAEGVGWLACAEGSEANGVAI
jgi:hypothetical protein